MKRMAIALTLLMLALAAIYLAGPRVGVDTAVRFDPATIGDDPDSYLARAEARFDDIREGLAKEIVWHDPEGRGRTPVALVYVHGFSASKGELRPLPDMVAEALGANLVFTRLAGHGRDGPAMAEASAEDWIDDVAEALAIGRMVGEKVVMMATSTGASLATWAATRPELSQDVAALVLVSPNYALRGRGAPLLTGPWGRQLARLFLGAESGFSPARAAQARLWTTRYPTEAILPMAAMVELARRAPVESIAIPAMFVFSDADLVVSPEATRALVARWGAPAHILAVDETEDPSAHVLAGDAYSPSTTRTMAEQVAAWLSSTLD